VTSHPYPALPVLQRPSDFDAKPMVLLLGQYSTGKTTFIKSILGKGYPGEPLIDRCRVKGP